MNFFLLRLDRFIQFLYTSSVITSLEFVFSNLCLTVSEDLLLLSVQQSPNLFAFRVLSLNFVILLVANNGFPRSIFDYDDITTVRRSLMRAEDEPITLNKA